MHNIPNMKSILFELALVLLSLSVRANLPPLPDGKAAKLQQQGRAVRSMPRIEGNSIVCGNKTVTFDLDGRVKITADGVTLGELYCYYSVTQKNGNKSWYGRFNKEVCSFKRNGEVFEWELRRQVENHTWKGADQKVSITPEGLVKVEFTPLAFEHPELQLRDPNNSLWFMLNNRIAVGAKHTFNDMPLIVPEDGQVKFDYSDKQRFNVTFFDGDPEKELKVLCGKNDINWLMARSYPAQHECRFTYVPHKGKTAVICFDIRQGLALESSNELRAGIDFKKIEELELPDGSRRNLLPNSSFERGLECYRLRHTNTNFRWGWKSYRVQGKEYYAGSNALEFDALRAKQYPSDDFRRLNCTHNVTTASLILSPGTYTFSLYAKCTPDNKALVNVWIPNFFSGSIYTTNDRTHIGRLPVSDTWERQSFTFKLDRTRPVEFHLNAACLGEGDCNVWIDALQLEEGSTVSAYDAPAAEGRLLTSEEKNFVNASEPVNGRLLITSKPEMEGSVQVRVKNFFSEILLNQAFTFKTDARGIATVALPLETLPGLGLFIVRADYALADGSRSFDIHRYARVHYLDNSNPLSRVFCFHYGRPDISSDYPEVLERWKRLGVGSRFFHYSYNKEIFDLEKQYGISPGFCYLFGFTRVNRGKIDGFAIADYDEHQAYLEHNDPKILIRDHNADSNGYPAPEYLERFRDAVSKIVAKHPHVTMWLPDGEAIARFPVEWWSKEGTAEQCAKIHALILKAFVDGVHKGNPNALALQDTPCNMRPEGGIAETDLLLTEADKIGCKFDVIGIHPYRSTPENPDLDSDADRFLKMLDKHGYDKTPVIWSEMMHWGPYSIPQLDIDFLRSGSGRSWYGGFLSYDIAKHEKISAAYYARAWLVALKYSSRVVGATAGNHHNNLYMDIMMTPYASQLVPNTLNGLLGESTFKEDIRFAPYIRTYLFEDAQKRPVAAVWCHREQVDDGTADAPVAEADFGQALEGVFDLMNSPREFTAGGFRFPVSGFPVFLRGKPGTLAQFSKAFNNASIISGEGISPIDVLVKPNSPNSVVVTLTNHLGTPFNGNLNDKRVAIPASGHIQVSLPSKKEISAEKIDPYQMSLQLQGDNGSNYIFPQMFEFFASRHLPEDATLDTVDWSTLPEVAIARQWKQPASTGCFKIGWNRKGVFLKAEIKDSVFVHEEYPVPGSRWKNDCLQLFFDTLGDARSKPHACDENDSSFGVFPNAKGDSASFFVFRPVDQQLGLGAQTPRNQSFISDVPCRFSSRDGVLTYEVFIKAPYLLPIKLQAGYCFGFAIFAPESSKADSINGALTLAEDGGVTSNRPHVWPLLLLIE